MEDKNKNFNDLASFLKSDMEIKDALIKAVPKDEDDSQKIDYSDKLFDQIKLIKFNFSKMLGLFDFSDQTKKVFEDKIKEIEERIAFGIFRDEYLNVVYQESLSKMRTDFVKKVSDTCKGYFTSRELKLDELIGEGKSVNELLHVLHSYVVNNDRILQSLPVLKQKEGVKNKYTIYGVENNIIADQILENIDVEKTKMGITDIVALPDRVLMMVRDVGHATTLEIKKDEATKQFGVTYSIPKACNIDKVNQLPGVTKLNDDANINSTTNGMFQIETEDIGKCIIDFIEQIPSDLDIPEREEKIDNNVEKEETALPKTQPKNVWIERFKKWRDKIREIPDKAKKLIDSLTNHNHNQER